MTASKKLGGLGFRDLIGFNLAMLAKISWRVLHTLDLVLGMILKDKSFPNSSFLEATKQNKLSWGWKGILLGRQVLNCGLWWRMGNGESIKIGSDPWIPKPHSFKPLMRHEASNLKVSELISPDRMQWKIDDVAAFVAPEDLELIYIIPISRSGCQDKRIWHCTKNGRYKVRSGYFLAMEMMKNGEFGRIGGDGRDVEKHIGFVGAE